MSDCIMFQGSVSKATGYGITKFDGILCSAHRAAYMQHVGSIPAEMCVLHKCDNRLCVNPQHLYLGTHKDNTADMMRRGRCKTVKFGDDVVDAVLAESRNLTDSTVAQKYNVSRSFVNHVRNGRRRSKI